METQKPLQGTALKRYSIKYTRDLAKANYPKKDYCYVCHITEELQLHHFVSLSILWDRWCRKNKIKIETVEDVLEHRVTFITEHHDELYCDVVVLCKTHHSDLHKLFGKAPVIGSAKAQNKWVEIRRKKWLEKVSSA